MNLILPLRIIQTVLAFIVLGLSAYCVDLTNGTYPAAAFLVFASVWTFVVLGYLLLMPMFFPDLHNRWAVVGLESVTMIFWFAGFIAIASSIGHVMCLGIGCPLPSSAKAAAVFGAFEWIAWMTSLGLIIHAYVQYRKGDGDAGNTTNSTTFVANFSSFFSFFSQKKKGKDLEDMSKDSNIEKGDGQTHQSYSEKNNTPKLPEMAPMPTRVLAVPT